MSKALTDRFYKKLIVLVLTVSAVAVLAGCGTKNGDDAGSGKSDVKSISEGGLTYYTLLDYSEIGDLPFGRSGLFSVKEDLKNRGIENDYVCVAGKDVPKDLLIPDEINGVPVLLLTSDPESSGEVRFDSVQLGKNLHYIYRFALHDECEDLDTLIIPSEVRNIEESFYNCKALCKLEFGEEFYNVTKSFMKCEALKKIEIPAGTDCLKDSFEGLKDAEVVINKTPSQLQDCFAYSENLVVVIKDTEGVEELKYSYPSDVGKELPYDYIIGSEEVLAYSAMVDEDRILQLGSIHFCEVLDEGKKIDPANAKNYAGLFDGPVISVETCPAISPSEYTALGRDALLKETVPLYLSIADNAWSCRRYGYPTMQKDTPMVYFIAEKTGGCAIDYTGNVGEKTYYQMAYRVSVRDLESDELICWFETKTGDVPGKIESTTVLTREGERSYFREGSNSEEVTPWYVIRKYFGG